MPRALPISREAVDGEFAYRLSGRRITKRSEIERIEALAIPPAWIDVEIARSPSAKVLARGIDAAGRTQTIYHPAFRRRQDRRKFDRMVRFAEHLPRIRARVDRDLRRRKLTRERVAACVIHLIDEQLFRVGNTRYADEHGSFGITTLREEHIDLTSTSVEFDFKGKSGQPHRRRVRDPRAARLLSHLIQLPGSEVFRFFDEDESLHHLRSRQVNHYVKRHMGEEFSAKDFRTWGGTVAVVAELFASDPETLQSPKARERLLRDAVKTAAEALGNTPAVTRSSYIDPRVLKAVERPRQLERLRRRQLRARRYLSVDEQRTLALLRASTR